jgi:hypothetical protein
LKKEDEKDIFADAKAAQAAVADRKEKEGEMKEAIQNRYEAKYLDEKKQQEAWNTDMQYKSKVAAEKIKATTAIEREDHQDKVDSDKLKSGTVANTWTANMPAHHSEGTQPASGAWGPIPKDKSLIEEESSDDESSDEE